MFFISQIWIWLFSKKIQQLVMCHTEADTSMCYLQPQTDYQIFTQKKLRCVSLTALKASTVVLNQMQATTGSQNSNYFTQIYTQQINWRCSTKWQIVTSQYVKAQLKGANNLEEMHQGLIDTSGENASNSYILWPNQIIS